MEGKGEATQKGIPSHVVICSFEWSLWKNLEPNLCLPHFVSGSFSINIQKYFKGNVIEIWKFQELIFEESKNSLEEANFTRK